MDARLVRLLTTDYKLIDKPGLRQQEVRRVKRAPRPPTVTRAGASVSSKCRLLQTLGRFVRATAAVGLLAAGAALAGCERDAPRRRGSAAHATSATIAVVTPPRADPAWAGIQGGALRFRAAIPSVEVKLFTPAGSSLTALGETLVEATSQSPAAACVYLTQTAVRGRDELGAILERAAGSNVIVITMGQRFAHRGVTGHVGMHLPSAAELLARNLRSLVSPKRSYLLVHSGDGPDVAGDAYRRFLSSIERWHDITCLASREGGGEVPAHDAILELVELFPHAGVIVSFDADPWCVEDRTWRQALAAASPTYRYATLAAAPALWRDLGTPQAPGPALALVGVADGDVTYSAIQMALELRMGEYRGAPERWIEPELVTAETLPSFAQRYSAAAGGLSIEGFLPGPADNATPASPATPADP